MSEANGDWLLEISFPLPYSGTEIGIGDDGGLKISIPFLSEQGAQIARGELDAAVRHRFEVIPGQVLRGEIEQ